MVLLRGNSQGHSARSWTLLGPKLPLGHRLLRPRPLVLPLSTRGHEPPQAIDPAHGCQAIPSAQTPVYSAAWGDGPVWVSGPDVRQPGYKVLVRDLPEETAVSDVQGWLHSSAERLANGYEFQGTVDINVTNPAASGRAQAFLTFSHKKDAATAFDICWHWKQGDHPTQHFGSVRIFRGGQ